MRHPLRPTWCITTGYTLGKASKTLGKAFAKCYTRQTTLGKCFIGKELFAECQTSGTRQRLCRVQKKHSANIFREKIKKTSPAATTTTPRRRRRHHHHAPQRCRIHALDPRRPPQPHRRRPAAVASSGSKARNRAGRPELAAAGEALVPGQGATRLRVKGPRRGRHQIPHHTTLLLPLESPVVGDGAEALRAAEDGMSVRREGARAGDYGLRAH